MNFITIDFELNITDVLTCLYQIVHEITVQNYVKPK